LSQLLRIKMRPRKKREVRKMLETRTESEARVGWSWTSWLKGILVKPSHRLGNGMTTHDSALLRSRSIGRCYELHVEKVWLKPLRTSGAISILDGNCSNI
jgi:hypothetical protein